MNVKVVLKTASPVIIDPLTPVDGILSSLLAVKSNYGYQTEEGNVQVGNLSLPASRYKYVLDLADYVEGEEYYRVSVLFGKNTYEGTYKLFRKFPNYLSKVFREFKEVRKDYALQTAKGKKRAIVRPVKVYHSEEFWFYASVKDDRVDEFVDLVEVLKFTGIGKKTGLGFGQVREVFVEEAEEFDGEFVRVNGGEIPARPLPVENDFVLPEGFYRIEFWGSLLPPYYLPVKLKPLAFCHPVPLLAFKEKN